MPAKQRILTIALEVVDTVLNIIITLALVFFIRTFIFSPFLISGVSMTPTLANSEYILVNKITYGNIFGYKLGQPKRGDVVVLKAPLPNRKDTVYYIKRIVGLPGETISFKGNKVYISNDTFPNGFELEEKYIRCIQEGRNCTNYYFPNGKGIFQIPEDSYFVMGDNRDQSTDSRSCFYSCSSSGSTHFVKRERIIGKSSVVLWPLTKARFIEKLQ